MQCATAVSYSICNVDMLSGPDFRVCLYKNILEQYNM